MSPSLFDVYMDAKMMKMRERLVNLNFADDVASLADSCLVTAAMIMRIEQVTKRFGIYISARKSEVLLSGEVKELSEWMTCS